MDRPGSLRTAVAMLVLAIGIAPAWTVRFHPDSGDACPAALAVDPARSVHVAGSVSGTGGADYLVLKYSSGGTLLWARTWDGPAGGSDSAGAVCVDGSGRVFVTGTAAHSTGRVMATLCWSGSGDLLWTAIHDTLAAGDEQGVGITTDGAGGCLVAGNAWAGTGHGLDISVTGWDSAGTRRWSQLYNGPGRNLDSATCAVGDDSGGVFVAGASAGFGDTLDYALLRYSRDGSLRWFDRQRVDSTAIPRVLHRDPALGIAVSGSACFGPTTGWDAYTICYRPDLTRRWTQRFTGPGSTDDHGLALDFGPDTTVYLAAVSCGNGTFLDAVGFRPNGTRAGPLIEQVSIDSILLPAGVAVVPFIGLVASASRQDTTGDWNYLLLGCDSVFEIDWESGYTGPFGDDLFRVQARFGSDALCLSGTSVNAAGSRDIVTLTHSLSGPGIVEHSDRPAPRPRLRAASPVRGVLPVWLGEDRDRSELVLCAVDGRVVHRERVQPGSTETRVSLGGLPAGVYLLRVTPDRGAAPARIVVIP